jgi:predicted Zn-dependent peptidase
VQLRSGQLDNGLKYIILPNAVPPNRFEAHLEVLSGSAHELDSQQVR